MGNGDKWRENLTFLTRAARQPTTMGAVLPTSQHVAGAVADLVPSFGSPVVLELGPGTGALSDQIHTRLPEGARHLAMEIDPELVRYLRDAKPWLEVFEGDAADLGALLESAGVHRVDAVISSIPWTLLPAHKQRELLGRISAVLSPAGVFTTVTYVTTLWRAQTRAFLAILQETFDEVLPRSTVWANLPPARVYACRRPRN